MTRYKSKMIFVEAVQLSNVRYGDPQVFAGERPPWLIEAILAGRIYLYRLYRSSENEPTVHASVVTPLGATEVQHGQWIVHNGKNELWIVGDEDFHAAYEPEAPAAPERSQP